MYHLPIIQTIAEDRIREMHQIAQDNRDARLARQRSASLRRAAGQARTHAALRLLPARIRPRLA
jgi:hypothetical protein